MTHQQEHPLQLTDVPQSVRRMWLGVNLAATDRHASVDTVAVLPGVTLEPAVVAPRVA